MEREPVLTNASSFADSVSTSAVFICSYCEPKTASNASMTDLKCEPLQLGF